MIEIGAIVDDRYVIIQQIGRGGTSSVYLAENIRTQSRWAIKEVYKNTEQSIYTGVLPPIAETRILTKLKNPGLPIIIDIIDTPEAYLIVMEYIEGISLEQVMCQQGAQSQEKVIEWGIQLCDVLEYLHSCNPPIIYRDMKPANIMLKPDGQLVLIDFGTVREYKISEEQDTINLGTYGYAAPEQFGGQGQTDARTDVYCLGMTLYYLVTGQNPSLLSYNTQAIRKVNEKLSAELEHVIIKATQLVKENRYQSMSEMRIELETTLSDGKGHKKKSVVGIISAIFVLLMLVGVSWFVLHNKNKSEEKFQKRSEMEEQHEIETKEEVEKEINSEINDTKGEESTEDKSATGGEDITGGGNTTGSGSTAGGGDITGGGSTTGSGSTAGGGDITGGGSATGSGSTTEKNDFKLDESDKENGGTSWGPFL